MDKYISKELELAILHMNYMTVTEYANHTDRDRSSILARIWRGTQRFVIDNHTGKYLIPSDNGNTKPVGVGHSLTTKHSRTYCTNCGAALSGDPFIFEPCPKMEK